jgi:hypothetical protein
VRPGPKYKVEFCSFGERAEVPVARDERNTLIESFRPDHYFLSRFNNLPCVFYFEFRVRFKKSQTLPRSWGLAIIREHAQFW